MYYLFSKKFDFFKTYLNDEFAEFGLNGKMYRIDFEIKDYTCIYSTMQFNFINEFFDDVLLEGDDLEKHGLDSKLIGYIHDEINDEINKEIEHWYYENYEHDPDEYIDDYLERKQKSINY